MYLISPFNYDGVEAKWIANDDGADIIGYDSCNSSADQSTDDHTDYRPNYCPTKTRKITTTDPNDGDLVDWTANSIADQVYAIEISTTDSK